MSRLAAAWLLAALAGCTVGPDFRPPVVAPPSVWGAEPGDVASRTTSTEVNPAWWQTFNDPILTSLVQRLVAQNLDLKAAAERVLQGRAQVQVARSQGLPHLSGEESYKRDGQSPKGFISLIEPAPGAPTEYDLFNNGASVSWELDLFGRVRRQTEAARANTLVALEDRRGIALASLAELAQDYLQLRGVQEQRAIAERNLAIATADAGLVRDRFANGVATTLDMAQARAQQASIAASLPPLRTDEAALINAIGLLLAEPPRALEAELRPPQALPPLPPVVPVGLPGTLVRRRPDVQQAEAQLHMATAQTGVAVANFYPDVSLTGTAELNGLHFGNAFDLHARQYDFGPSVSIPLFQGGRLTGELRLRKAQQREAADRFQQTVLQAWQEVDNALTAYAEAQHRRGDVAEAVRQNGLALIAARQRYIAGASDFLNVNSSEAQLLQAQNDAAILDVQIATDLVTLYRALGGGWEVSDAALAVETASP